MEEINQDMMDAIHYPECWDTAVFPTLVTALWEMIMLEEGQKCGVCGEAQGLECSQKTGGEK